MDEPVVADLFVEDRAHEEFLMPLLRRISRERDKTMRVRVRSARGGHGRALAELELYQKAVAGGLGGLVMPDLVVIGIDGNCKPYHSARKDILSQLDEVFRNKAVIACPAPHIEKWFLADASAFTRVVGSAPRVRKDKCKRDYYKGLLLQAVVDGGHVPTLGGIEFAREIVDAMDLFDAGKADQSLKAFLDEIGAFLERS